jgi:hypothetical protein
MKHALIIAAAVAGALLSAPAYAADLPVKAPVAPLLAGYPYQGSGLYGGVGAVAGVLSADVGGNTGGTSLFSAGASLDLTAGYQFTRGGNWYALEASVQYTNMGGAVACPAPELNCSISSKWGFEQRGLIGFPIQTVLSVMPNLGNFFPALPALPGGVNASTTNTHPYVFAGIREDDVSAEFGIARAQTWKIQPVAGLKPQTFASLTGCSGTIEGTVASVTDSSTATWGAAITGSSTNHVLAYCDGTN